jgi:hypothetical protein
MSEFSRRLDELLLQRQSYQASLNAAENAEASPFAERFIEMNSKFLPELRKEIWDARNRTPMGKRCVRKVLLKLAKRIDATVNGVESRRKADLSEAREYELHADLSAAKTNHGRRRAGRQIAQQNRDRDLLKKHQKAALPGYEIAARKKQIYNAKKAGRVFSKLCKTAQFSACVRNSADLESNISDRTKGRSAC